MPSGVDLESLENAKARTLRMESLSATEAFDRILPCSAFIGSRAIHASHGAEQGPANLGQYVLSMISFTIYPRSPLHERERSDTA
jgi:hypothetical protein